LLTKINEVRAQNTSMSFSAARDVVFKANPKLAKEYIVMHDGGEA